MRTIARNIVGGFVFSKDNKLLLGLMHPKAGGAYSGMWVVPGGGVGVGETKEQALIREFIEETGIDLSSYKIKFIDDKFDDINDSDTREKTLKETGERVLVNMTFNNFEVHIDRLASQIQTQPNEEFDKLDWFAIPDLINVNLAPGVRAALKRWRYTK